MKKSDSQQTGWDDVSLTPYSVQLALDRLVPGVDNIHYDVRLSPALCNAAIFYIQHHIVECSGARDYPYTDYRPTDEMKIRDEFRQHSLEVLSAAIHKAKQEREIQINFLAQAALFKMILEEIRIQFAALIEHYKKLSHRASVAQNDRIEPVFRLKEDIASLQKNRQQIISDVSGKIFDFLLDAQENELRKVREANFGAESILPAHFFSNPLVYIDNAIDDFFMVNTYVLLGARLEDPLKYDALLGLFEEFFDTCNIIIETNDGQPVAEENEDEVILAEALSEDGIIPPAATRVDAVSTIRDCLKITANVDILFNYFDVEKRLKKQKRRGATKEEIVRSKASLKNRKKRIQQFYKYLKKNKIIQGIVAGYEMQPLYKEYCPPLFPHEILRFLYSSKDRNAITTKIKRLKNASGRSLSLIPLKKLVRDLTRVKPVKKKDYIIRFMKDFSRYHRDLYNYRLFKETMDWINLTTDEKTINLSRVNHTLYEFLLNKEKGFEERPIVNHVIIKTDVRGSTDITNQIKARGLNPASYFSLNFFNPITAILEEYGATKVFIEGDAIILAIFEKEETPEDWYSVARACGLAINMLMITQRYNANSKKHRFPVLEQGIGICYRNSPPTFLFDGENRIMISPAINQADRLSSCDKHLRKKKQDEKAPFNLYVYQTVQDEDMIGTSDDLLSRYNVNGIELNSDGFEKLKEEIKLKTLTCRMPETFNRPFTVHTGIFPTISGKYQRLVIRESTVPLVSPDTMEPMRQTGRKFYEVCTNRKLYEWAKWQVRRK